MNATPPAGRAHRTRPARTAVFLALAALAAAGCSQGFEPTESVGKTRQPVLGTTQINGDSLPPKTVVFTYDDGPDEHTLELAQYLHDQGIHATFFTNGRRYCKEFDSSGNCTTPWDTLACDNGLSQAPVTNPKHYPESNIDLVLALGHRIGNHSQDHCHLTQETNASDFLFELKTTQDIVDRHICDNVFLFRTPYGEWDDATAARAQGTGLDKLIGPVNWDVDGEDWNCWQMGTTVEACGQGYLNILNMRPNQNGIFLMHDRPEFNVGYEGPLLMAQWIVPQLKAAGFQFATLEDVATLPVMPCITPPQDAGAGDTGGSSGGDDASSDDGGSSTSSSGGVTGSTSGSASGGSSGGSTSGGSTSGGGSTSSSGNASSGAGSGGSSGSGAGSSSGSGTAEGDAGGSGAAPTGQSSGCACTGAPGGGAPDPASGALLAFGAVVIARRSRRRPKQHS
jgi:MYXO-CTERM domain-containing protein